MNIEDLAERERIITRFVEFLFFFIFFHFFFFLSLADTRIFVYKISFSPIVIVTISRFSSHLSKLCKISIMINERSSKIKRSIKNNLFPSNVRGKYFVNYIL